jgi:hypothetical protein
MLFIIVSIQHTALSSAFIIKVGLQAYINLDEEDIWMCARIGVGDITTA